ncbi:24244_t:CDS:2, partial [Dentiscutata erythropus]
DRFTDNIVNKLHQIKVYAAIGFDMKKGINICYPLSTITIPKTYSETSYLKILIENFWCLRNALQEIIELVIEINEDLEQLHDSRPSKNVGGFLQYWNIYVPKTFIHYRVLVLRVKKSETTFPGNTGLWSLSTSSFV